MLVVIKGAGDLATGIAYRLKVSGFQVIMTEISQPTVVRHTVAFATAVYSNFSEVEGIRGVLCEDDCQVQQTLERGEIPIVIDKQGEVIKRWSPAIVVDAIIAKHNKGTKITDAPIVVGVGPGFVAGEDCHYVIETMRGHNLGRVFISGHAFPNTGIPGEIAGFTKERIIRAHRAGDFQAKSKIGDTVKKGDIVGYVENEPIHALIDGVVRGMLFEPMFVTKGFKCGDIDPRCKIEHCYTISDKARAIGGGVLEAILRGKIQNNL